MSLSTPRYDDDDEEEEEEEQDENSVYIDQPLIVNSQEHIANEEAQH